MRKLLALFAVLFLAACAAVDQKDAVADRAITEASTPETAVTGGNTLRTQGGAPQGPNISSEVGRGR